jgi:hypothetical protein
MIKANCRELSLEGSYPPSAVLFSVRPGDTAASEGSCAAVERFIAAYPRESKR